MELSTLQFCSLSSILRAFCRDAYSVEVNQIFRQISENRKFDCLLEGILQELVKTYPKFVNDRFLCGLLAGKILLTKLDLKDCTNISMNGFASALKSQHRIQYLDLTGCNQLANGAIADVLGKSVPCLAILIFESCDGLKDDTVQRIIKNCVNLTYISIASSPNITDEIFNLDLGNNPSASLTCPTNVSLTGVDLSGCRNISSTAIRHLFQLCGPQLTKVNISWTNIDATVLVYLAGYTLSSAVYVSINASDEEKPFTTAELNILQECEFDMANVTCNESLNSPAYPILPNELESCLNILEKDLTIDSLEDNDCSEYHDKRKGDKLIKKEETFTEDIPVKCDMKANSPINDKETDDGVNTLSHNMVGKINDCTFNVDKSINLEKNCLSGCDTSTKSNVCDTYKLLSSSETFDSIYASNITSKNTNRNSQGDGCCTRLLTATNDIYQDETCFEDLTAEKSLPKIHSNDDALQGSVREFDKMKTNFAWNEVEKSTPSTSNGDLNRLEIHTSSNAKKSPLLYTPKQMFYCQITELDITEIKFHDYQVGVSCLKMFVLINRNLKAFSISWNMLNNDLLEFIALNEPELVKIGLMDCESLSNSGIKILGKYCKKLSNIDLQGVPFLSDDGLLGILVDGNLWSLSLAECAITDITLRYIADYCCDTIENLDLSWCELITDDGIAYLVRSCQKLKVLNLRQCAVSLHSLDALKDNAVNLIQLGLSSVQEISDSHVVGFSRNLRNLTNVDISWNICMTDDSISAVLLNCKMLNEINLSGLKRISTQPFLPIISGLSDWRRKRESIRNRLRERNIVCSARDLGALEVFDSEFYLPYRSLHYATHLHKVDMSFCDRMDDNHLAELISVCRGTLNIDDYYSVPVNPRWKL